MARLSFPDDRTVYAPANGIWRTAQAGAPVSIYVDSNPGVDPPVPGAAADVLRSDGTAGTIIVDSNSQMASWLGPADGSDTLIVQITGGPYWRVSARATDRIDALDTRMTAVESGGSGGVPTSRTITAGTGLTGGGDLTANRTLAVAYGATSTTVAVGNDSRIVGAVQASVAPPSGDATGVTDRTNIQTAFDTGASRIIFLPGTYILDLDVQPHSGQTLICHGATFIRAAGNATEMNLISIAGTSTSLIFDVHIYGGTWDGNKANVTSVNLEQYGYNNGIRVAWARDVSIDDVTVQNCWGGGVLAGDSVVSGLRISDSLARNSWDNGIFIRPGCVDVVVDGCNAYGHLYHGIAAIRSNFVTFMNSRAWGNGPTASGEGSGFRLDGCSWSQVIGCSAWNNGLLGGLSLTGTLEGQTGWSWKGAYSDATTYAVGDVVYWPPRSNERTSWYCLAVPPVGTAPAKGSTYWTPCAYDSDQGSGRAGYSTAVRDCRFTDNFALETAGTWKTGAAYVRNDSVYYYDGSTWGIYLCTAAVTGSTAPPSDTDHWLAASYASGINCQDQINVEISNCVIANNYTGISIGAGQGVGCDEIRVIGCDIRDNTNGISLDNQTAAKNFAVRDCHFSGNFDGIKTSALAYLAVSGCEFDGNSGNGIETGSGAVRVDIYDNVFSGTVAQQRAWYEGGSSSTIRAGGNVISGQSVEPFHLASATSWIDGTNLIDVAVDHASGTGSFTASATCTVTFATAFVIAPSAAGVAITPTGAPAGAWYVSAISTTSFTLTCSTSGSWAFAWQVRNLPGA